MLLTARRLPVYPSGLQPQHYCNLVTTVLPRAPRAIRPHLEREVLPLGGHEAQLLEERGLAGERQHLAGRDVRGHEGLELRHVGEHRRSHHHTGEQGEGRGTRRCTERTSPLSLLPEDRHRAHARTSSRIPTPRSSSSRVTTSGGTRRITFAPAVATSRWRSRAAATKGAAGSVSSIPHIRPRPRTSATRLRRAATPARDAPSHAPSSRTAARKPGSAIVRTTARATRASSGPPPNVVAWSPGFKAAAMPSVRSTAPIGSPPASGFARVSMSGTTSACS